MLFAQPYLKRPLLTLLLLLIGVLGVLSAQTVGMSDEKRESLVPLQTVVTYGDTGTVLVLLENPVRPQGVSMIQLDTTGGVVVRREVALGSDVLPEFYEAAFAWGDRLTLLTSLYYPGPQRNYLIVRQYSLPGLEEVYSGRVDEVYMPFDLQIPFGYSISPKKDRLLLYGWSYTTGQDSARLSLTLFDQGMQEVSDREVKLPYSNETFQLYGALLDQEGGIYLLTEDYKGNPQGWGFNESKLQPALLYLPPSGESFREYILGEDRREILSGLRITLGGDGKLYGAGFYQRRNRSQHEGLFTFSLHGPSREFRSNKAPIERNAFRDAGSDRNTNFEGFTIDELWREEGRLLWVAEKLGPDPSGSSDLAFGDLLVGSLSPTGQLDWLDRIPRDMRGGYAAASMLSFSAFRYDGKYHLLFAGNTDNYPERVPYFMATYTPEGKDDLRDITRTLRRSGTGMPQPMLGFPVQKEKLLIFGINVQANSANSSASNTRFLLQLLRAGDEYSPTQYQGYLIFLRL